MTGEQFSMGATEFKLESFHALADKQHPAFG